MTIRKRLEALQLSLPAPRKPAFSYQAVVVDQGLAWVSGQLPWQGDSMDLVHTGCLGLLIDVFGELGRHARSAVGVAALPRGAPVEIELVVRCN